MLLHFTQPPYPLLPPLPADFCFCIGQNRHDGGKEKILTTTQKAKSKNEYKYKIANLKQYCHVNTSLQMEDTWVLQSQNDPRQFSYLIASCQESDG